MKYFGYVLHDITSVNHYYSLDSLVLHLQLIHDGDISGGAGQYDSHEDSA